MLPCIALKYICIEKRFKHLVGLFITTRKLIRSRVQMFPAWHTKAAPNGKCCEGYIVPSMVRLISWKVCWNKERPCWKIAKLFYFCHLKKLVRPETFGPYYVQSAIRRAYFCQNIRVLSIILIVSNFSFTTICSVSILIILRYMLHPIYMQTKKTGTSHF